MLTQKEKELDHENVSALENIHKHGLFGNHDSKDELINIRGN